RSRTQRGAQGEDVMLDVYRLMIEVLGMLRGPLTGIERHDKDLGNQLRRAASSVALNIAEGSGSHGGTRLTRYRTAVGSGTGSGSGAGSARGSGSGRGPGSGRGSRSGPGPGSGSDLRALARP